MVLPIPVLPIPLLISFPAAYFWLNLHLNNYVMAADLMYRNMGFAANRSRVNLDAQLTAFLTGVAPAALVNSKINQMIEISKGSTHPFERAEIQLVCARAYFIVGDYVKALDLLDNAIQAYVSDPHNQAVVFWMKGCVLLDMLGKNVDTILLWQHSLEKFNKLAKSRHVQQRGADWYQRRCIEMKVDINAVI